MLPISLEKICNFYKAFYSIESPVRNDRAFLILGIGFILWNQYG